MASVTIPDVKCIKETGKALLCQIEGEEHWIPKSQVNDDSEVFEEGGEGVLSITEWIAVEKNLV